MAPMLIHSAALMLLGSDGFFVVQLYAAAFVLLVALNKSIKTPVKIQTKLAI